MNLLLDTHTLLWWHAEPVRLSATARSAIADSANQIFLSVISVWEIQIKAQLGRLHLPKPVSAIVNEEVTVNHLSVLPVVLGHVYELDKLPLHHSDPFDRLLIAQAREERLVLVTRDTSIREYEADVLW